MKTKRTINLTNSLPFTTIGTDRNFPYCYGVTLILRNQRIMLQFIRKFHLSLQQCLTTQQQHSITISHPLSIL